MGRALILLDLQPGVLGARPGGAAWAEAAADLARRAHAADVPVVCVTDPAAPPSAPALPEGLPIALTMERAGANPFADLELDAELTILGAELLTILGPAAPERLAGTVEGALELGFRVELVEPVGPSLDLSADPAPPPRLTRPAAQEIDFTTA